MGMSEAVRIIIILGALLGMIRDQGYCTSGGCLAVLGENDCIHRFCIIRWFPALKNQYCKYR